VRFHTGYQVDADGWADVSALCERFGIPVPDDYRRFGRAERGTPQRAMRRTCAEGAGRAASRSCSAGSSWR
jgi:hypothetical protein